MLKMFKRDKYPKNSVVILLMIYFFLNGTVMYYNILMIKISKTIYRGIYSAIQNLSVFVGLALSEAIHLQMENYHLFLSVTNLLCLLTLTFLSEFKELPYLINDIKLYSNRDNNSGHNN